MNDEKRDRNGSQAQRSRRDVLKAGAVLIPTIVTLHASPAWAATDYTTTAYRYGTNAGLCRNPEFQEGSNAPWKKDEFVPCEQVAPTSTYDGAAGSSRLDTQEIQF